MTAFVLPHDPAWKDAYASEAAALTAALPSLPLTLHHIGSTAVPGLLAKPIIDILGAVADLALLDTRTAALEDLGYETMGAYGIDGRLYFRKFDAQGRRSHHLHIFETGSPHIARHLAFRDYLRAHAGVAAAYSDLKARLTAGNTPSWEAYIDGKAPFVRATEAQALAWSRRRPH